jgi:hypothetical protein
MVDKIQELLLADKNEAEVLKLNDANKTSFKLKDVIAAIVSTIPESAKVPQGEDLQYNEISNPDSKKVKNESEKLSEKHRDAIDAGHKSATARYKGKKKSSIDIETPSAETV